jgi:glycerate 2-kinase
VANPNALVCPDKFRGTFTAREAAAAIAAGLRAAGFDRVRELPLADGGEGTLDVLLAALGGERRASWVTGPDGGQVEAEWGLLPDGRAVAEMARASGLSLVVGRNDPLAATTRGTGELIVAAAEAGASEVILGVGGSATTDGGLDAVEALGWSLPVPVTVGCDVSTRFIDAAPIFGPQKGATPVQVVMLERRLQARAALYLDRTGVDVVSMAGSGAAGGLAGGLAAIGASVRPGFEVVAEAVGFEEALSSADVVVTGEGRLDASSLSGKVVGRVLEAARVPCGIVAGQAAENLPTLPGNPIVVLLAGRRLTEAAAELGSRLLEQ